MRFGKLTRYWNCKTGMDATFMDVGTSLAVELWTHAWLVGFSIVSWRNWRIHLLPLTITFYHQTPPEGWIIHRHSRCPILTRA